MNAPIQSVFFRVGVQLPSVEVRYKNLCVEAECEVVHGKPLPTLWNSLQSLLSVSIKPVTVNLLCIEVLI